MFTENNAETEEYPNKQGAGSVEMESKQINFGNGAGALLEMLAEVASQTLRSDPSVKGSHATTITSCNTLDRTKNMIKRKRISHRGRERGIKDLDYIRTLTANQLIKMFSEFDGDEMKKMFTFKCTFEPQQCNKHYASFGSEGKARQQVKLHLLEHVKILEEAESKKAAAYEVNIQSSSFHNMKKRRRTDGKLLKETLSVENVSNENDSSVSNKENSHIGVDSSSSSFDCPVLNSNKTDIVPVVKKEKQKDKMKTIEKTKFEVNLELEGIKTEIDDACNQKEIVCDDIFSEHNYTTFGVKLLNVDSKNVENKHMTTSCHDNPVQCENVNPKSEKSTTEETLYNMVAASTDRAHYHLDNLPCVGQEIDVSTCLSPRKYSGECGTLKSKLEKIIDKQATFRELNKNIERDEHRFKKKPKGKAKFIGQSKAEKEMAIQMIDSMKRKENVMESLECRICNPPRSFTAPTTLISHYRSHAGIKPYECRLCRSVFTRQHSLNYHMLIHTNQTRFTCSDCGRKFRHPSHFKEHRRRHTGESPYECSDCMLRLQNIQSSSISDISDRPHLWEALELLRSHWRFKTRNTYKRHLKTRHGKVLTTSGSLIALSEEEFKCVKTSPRTVDTSTKNGVRRGYHKGKLLLKSIGRKKSPLGKNENKMDPHLCNSSFNDIEDLKDIETEEGLHLEACRKCESDCSDSSSDTDDTLKSGQKRSMEFDDIVEEAMRQSNISFTNLIDEKSELSDDANLYLENEGITSSEDKDHIDSESYLREKNEMENTKVNNMWKFENRALEDLLESKINETGKGNFLASNSKCIAQLLPQASNEHLLVSNALALNPIFVDPFFTDKQDVNTIINNNHGTSSPLTVITGQFSEDSQHISNTTVVNISCGNGIEILNENVETPAIMFVTDAPVGNNILKSVVS